MNSSLTQDLPQVIPLEEAMKVIESSEYVNNGLPQEYVAATLEVYVDALRLLWYVLIPMSGLGKLYKTHLCIDLIYLLTTLYHSFHLLPLYQT